jgi:hypothetical protein
MKKRKTTALIAAAAAAAAIALPATANADPVASPAPVAHGVEAPLGAAPWAQVGPGWTLAMWSPAVDTRSGEQPAPGAPTFQTATTTLYLVDPAGGRYAITTFEPSSNGPPELIDWSGDGSRALIETLRPTSSTPSTTVTEVDLHTGTKTTLPPLPGDIDPSFGYVHYTRPSGKALLLATWINGEKPGRLVRVDLAGNTQLTYPTDKLGSTFSGDYVSTPDGTRLVLGTTAGLSLMGNDGTVGPTLTIPGETGCSPLRWWDTGSTTVLAKCSGDKGSQLWRVPIDGSAPTALTAPNNGKVGPDYGDADAWQLPAGTFVQDDGACGVIYLAKLNANGTTTPVSVPDVHSDSSVAVVGVNGGDLDVTAGLGCGGGKSLLDYNPAANTTTVLLGPPVNGGSVLQALPYADRK